MKKLDIRIGLRRLNQCTRIKKKMKTKLMSIWLMFTLEQTRGTILHIFHLFGSLSLALCGRRKIISFNLFALFYLFPHFNCQSSFSSALSLSLSLTHTFFTVSLENIYNRRTQKSYEKTIEWKKMANCERKRCREQVLSKFESWAHS